VVTDWLDFSTILEIQDTAWDCSKNWYKPFREDFTSCGVCWPEIDFDNIWVRSHSRP